MKTIPILLSTLTLATSGTGVAMPMAIQDIGEQALVAATTPSYEDILLGTNEFSDYVQIQNINFDRETVRFAIDIPRDRWQIKRVMVAHRDYEGGISEVEADTKLTTLGVEDSKNWAIMMVDRKVAAPGMLGVSYNSGMAKQTLVGNLSDQIYYAVEFSEYSITENGTKVWGTETQWVRGKVDYRSCIHSQMFESVKATQCTVVKEDAKYKAIPQRLEDGTNLTPSADERVISWEDEWRAVQLARVQETTDQLLEVWEKLQLVTKQVEDGMNIADKADLAYVEVGDDAGNQFSKKVAGLHEIIRKITGTYAGLQGKELLEENQTLTRQIAQLMAEKVQWEQDKTGLENKNNQLVAEKDDLAQENQDLRQEIQELKQKLADSTEKKDENDSAVSDNSNENKKPVEQPETDVIQDSTSNTPSAGSEQNKVIEIASEPKTVAKSTAVVKNTSESAKTEGEGTTTAPVARVESEQSKTETEEVDIPDLGIRESKKSQSWWLPIVAAGVALCGALGVIVVKLKRR